MAIISFRWDGWDGSGMIVVGEVRIVHGAAESFIAKAEKNETGTQGNQQKI